MLLRNITPSNNSSFFVFGARGTGKTTWLKAIFANKPHLWIDLLDENEESELALNPALLKTKVQNLHNTEWVVIDEIQKIPKLLDMVHLLIEEKKLKFALTGSSARKLKRGAANLLAGRAFVYHMYPLTWSELGDSANLENILRWGSLPKVFSLNDPEDKNQYLRAYTKTYLAEEVVAEQLVRNLLPFRKFLPVAAHQNGRLINYSKISKDIGIDDKTVQTYYEILEDTHMGFRLFPFHSSFRKRLSHQPKFYFFDIGVTRALARLLEVPLVPQTSAYGDTFEHFVILEFARLISCYYPDYEMTYLQTKDGAEVDLVIDRPGQAPVLVEIKSTERVDESHTRTIGKLAADLKGAEAYCLSRDKNKKEINNVTALPWQEGLKTILPKILQPHSQ